MASNTEHNINIVSKSENDQIKNLVKALNDLKQIISKPKPSEKGTDQSALFRLIERLISSIANQQTGIDKELKNITKELKSPPSDKVAASKPASKLLDQSLNVIKAIDRLV